MGEMAQKIVKADLKDLLRVLNEAYAEEWLAYYQYWIGACLAQGQMRRGIVKEFNEHAKEELEHAQLLADRILQLGGTPLIDPSEWSKEAKCRYEAPLKADTQSLVRQALTSERCAIGRYQGICDMCFGKDYETFRISKHILKEELDHEQDMEDFLNDMSVAKDYYEDRVL
jgi:bacterioferritin